MMRYQKQISISHFAKCSAELQKTETKQFQFQKKIKIYIYVDFFIFPL